MTDPDGIKEFLRAPDPRRTKELEDEITELYAAIAENEARPIIEAIELLTSERFGGALGAVRRARGLTQAKVSAQLGVADSAFGSWERGERWPSIENMRSIAAWLKAPAP